MIPETKHRPPLRRRIPRQDRAKRKVERILSAARRILETEGPSAFHMSRIARDVGVSIGTVYEYFPDKAAIVEELIQRAAAEESDAVLARLSQGAGVVHASVRAAVATVFDLFRRHHALVIALRALTAEAWDVGGRPTERLIQSALEHQLLPLLRDRPGKDPRMVAFVVFHCVESLASRMLDHRDATWTDDQCVDEIARVVLRYLEVPDLP